MRSAVDRLDHIVRHPRSLLPGSPSGIINSARDWVIEQQRCVPADIRRGPPAQFWEIEPPALRCVPAPAGTDDGAAPLARLFPLQPSTLFFIKGARVLGREGVVISPDNRVFAEFTYADAPGGIDSHDVFRRRRFPRPTHLPGSYATLCYPSSFAYFHWIVESLPRVRMIQPYLEALDGVFVPEEMEASLKQSLLAVGIPERLWLPLRMGSHFQPQHLLVPGYCAGLDVPPWVPAFLRERVLGERPPREGKRIYVSRGDASKRRVLNEVELVPLLEQRSFEIVRLRELDFVAQARLFDSADVVIGAHGAGLANAVFCRPGSRMLELLPSPRIRPHVYYSLITAAGGHYHHIAGQPSGRLPVDDEVHADFIVSPTELSRKLDTMELH